jgi:hypothetical protein
MSKVTIALGSFIIGACFAFTPLLATPALGVDCIALGARVTWSATKFAFADIRSRCIEPTAAMAGGPIQTPKKPTAFGVSAKHSKSEKLLTPVSHG